MQYVNTDGLKFVLNRLKTYISSKMDEIVTRDEFDTKIEEINDLVNTLLGNITEGSESDIANKLSQLNNDVENFNNIFNEFKTNNPNALETLESVLELQDLVMNIKSLLDIKFVGDLSDIEIDGTLNQQAPGINIEDLHEDLQNRIRKPLTIVQQTGEEIDINSEINFVESVKTNSGDPEKNNSDSLNVIVTSNKIKYKDIVNTIFSITYNELLSCINDNLLIKGMMYRINDYVTTTSQFGTSSNLRPFDLIVTALDTNKLSEDAYAIQHEEDTYFNNQNLSSWELKYCVHNDTTKFEWADTENGKGVIYYMKDEYGNEAPYDFKNIMFYGNYGPQFTFSEYRILSVNGTTGETTYGYVDASLLGYVNDNKIGKYYNDKVLSLAKNTFISRYDAIDKHISYNVIGNNCINNIFGSGAINNKIENDCTNNTFKELCTNNILEYNSSGNYFENNCSDNKLGFECQNNFFRYNCIGNILNNRCQNNELNNDNKYNVFGNNCSGNKLKDNSYSNIFDSNCSGNTFEFGCNNVVFNVGCSDNIFKNVNIRISEMVLEPGCSKNEFNVKSGESSLYNIYANMGVKELTIDELWNPYDERKIDIVNKNSKALEYCLADFIVPTNPASIDRNLYATFLFKTDGLITFTYNTDTPETEYLEYNVGGNTTDWKKYTKDSSIAMRPNSEISFRGNITAKPESEDTTEGGIGQFHIYTGDVTLYGQLSSLVSDITKDYLFDGLFSDCTGITNVSKDLLVNINLTEYCFNYMFSGCTSLKNVPELPAPKLPKTDLKPYCYEAMFNNCTSLETSPELPATTLSEGCYNHMFSGCTSLVDAPKLPATTLATSCYQNMFSGCTSLETPPELLATTLATSCYENMFLGCTSLVSAPELPATTLATGCYENMFSGCTSLVNAPELLATTLWQRCYLGMFSSCTSLVNAPELPATTLAPNCYYAMFNNCTSLNYIKALFIDEPSNIYMKIWVQNVAPTGIFVKNRDANWAAETVERGPNSIPVGWNIEGDIKYIAEDKRENYFTVLPLNGEVYSDPLYIKFKPFDNTTGTLYYTTNYIDSDWKELLPNTSIVFENFGNEIKSVTFKGNLNINTNNDNSSTIYPLCTLNITSASDITNPDIRVSLNGKLASIMFEDNITGEEILPDFCFSYLFNTLEPDEYFSVISDASNLKLPTKLSKACYYAMFAGCTSLTKAPELPATTLTDFCYMAMFGNCTSLTEVLKLPATTLADYCYYSMFSGCTSLKNVPELPATTLAQNCYSGMFGNCTSLTEAPKLLATTLSDYCYHSMFEGCTSLETPPELLATTLATGCYVNMFKGCTSLETPPELPATTLNPYCYDGMFTNCTALKTSPELPATTLKQSCYQDMFSGCTSLANAPELPAFTLTYDCYNSMFKGCTSLTESPKLKAQLLITGCYSNMFANCSNLNKICAAFKDEPSETYMANWVQNVAGFGTIELNPDITWDPDLDLYRGISAIPFNWNVQPIPDNLNTFVIADEFIEDGKDTAKYTEFKFKTGMTWNDFISSPVLNYSKQFYKDIDKVMYRSSDGKSFEVWLIHVVPDAVDSQSDILCTDTIISTNDMSDNNYYCLSKSV